MEEKTIAFVGGKSGGHIIPCLTLGKEKKIIDNEYRIIFFTTDGALDAKIIKESELVEKHIPLTLSKRPSSIKELFSFFRQFFKSFLTSFKIFIMEEPEKIISTGSIVSIPVCLAAFVTRTPIHLYTLDVIPGKTLKFLYPFATKIHYCFHKTKIMLPQKKSAFSNYPIKYSTKEYTKTTHTARLTLGLNPEKKTLCILGGSQGSVFINNLIVEWIEQNQHLHSEIQIIHQIGTTTSHEWHLIYPRYKIPAYVFDYRSNLSNIYAASDLIICRAGAGTLFEVQKFGKSCLVIPLEITSNTHQLNNAQAMVEQYPEQFRLFRQVEIEHNRSLFFEYLHTMLYHYCNHI